MNKNKKFTYTNKSDLRDFGISGFISMIQLDKSFKTLPFRSDKIKIDCVKDEQGNNEAGYNAIPSNYYKPGNILKNYELFYTISKNIEGAKQHFTTLEEKGNHVKFYTDMEDYFLNNTAECYAFFKERNVFNLIFKKYLGDGYEIKNFNNIEKTFLRNRQNYFRSFVWHSKNCFNL